MRSPLWYLRSLAASVMGELACITCGRPTVGYSVYCRRHTDEILYREPQTVEEAHE